MEDNTSLQLDISRVSAANKLDIDLNTRREISYLQATMYYSVYFTNLLINRFLTTFRSFPTIVRRFPKILKMVSGNHTNVSEYFPNFCENFRRFPNNSEDCQGRSEDVST